MSFVIYRNARGSPKLVDAALTRAMRLQCPECGRQNNFTIFQFEELDGSVGRRYYYVCPDCKIHYTNWGPDCDYRGSHKIARRCQDPTEHQEERRRFIRALRAGKA